MNAYRYAIRALKGALRNMFHPAVLAVMLFPALTALFVWGVVSWWFWDTWSERITSILVDLTADGWLDSLGLTSYAGFAAGMVLVMLIAPAILATAMLISAMFAMPVLVTHVARRDFPNLERRRGGTFSGSVMNAVVAVCGFLLLWLITLPLWLLLGPFAVLIPWALSAYLNQRLFRYDALSEHADPNEMRRIFQERFSDLFVLGLLTGLFYFVPVVNLIAPVFSALAFTWLCLDDLARVREQASGAQGTLVRG